VKVGSDITDPTAVTWLDPDHLLVLGQVGPRSELFEVPLNGGSSTEIAVPHGVTSVAANWPSAAELPRVVVAVPGEGNDPGRIWISKAGLLNRGWSPVAKGGTPVFPG
jgi:Lipoprotein LpqB beta-propeller domain